MNETIDWEKIRRNRYATSRPDDWPPEVQGISLNGLGLFGIHRRTGELYWDGQPLVTRRSWTLNERLIAWVGVGSAVVLVGIEIGRAAGMWGG